MDIQGLQLLESCAYTWVFDGATRLFRRFPREARVCIEPSTGWRPYQTLEIDGARSCFVVTLDETGTRRLRAWLHRDPCGRCARGLSAQRRHPIRPFGGWPQADDAA